jgi:hypothetical protein
MVSLTSTAYSQCGPSTTLTCEPISKFIDEEYGVGVFAIQINGTTFTSGSTVEDGGYRKNSCDKFVLDANTNYSISVTTGDTYNEDVAVYIDYNGDGDFNDSGELVFESYDKLTNHSGTFTTPSFVSQNTVWVRVTSDFSGVERDLTPCSAAEFGQIEDFTAEIIPNPALNDGPTFVVEKFCGTTLQMNTTFSAKAVSGAEMYEFELTSLSDASIITSQRVGRCTRLNLFEGV